MTIAHVIRKALADNLERIPFTIDGGYIATDIGETNEEENLHIIVSGYMEKTGLMLQQVTVIYFDSLEKANRFIITASCQMVSSKSLIQIPWT